MDQRANTKVYQAWKVTEREAGSAALGVVSFMAFMPLPQAWGMLAPFIWSWQARRIDKDHTTVTRCGLELSGRNSAAGWYLVAPHSPSIPQIRQDQAQLDTSPAELQETDPFPAAVLFTGFQGSRLPSLETSMTGVPAAEGSCRTV